MTTALFSGCLQPSGGYHSFGRAGCCRCLSLSGPLAPRPQSWGEVLSQLLKTQHDIQKDVSAVQLELHKWSRDQQGDCQSPWQTDRAAPAFRSETATSYQLPSRRGNVTDDANDPEELLDISDEEFERTQTQVTAVAVALPFGWPLTLMNRYVYESDIPHQNILKYRNSASRLMGFRQSVKKTGSFRLDPTSFLPNVYRRLVLLPDSSALLVLDTLSGICFFTDLIMIPYTLAWDIPLVGGWQVVTLLLASFWTLHIFVSFFTAFYHKGTLVASFHKVAKTYLKTWFVPDVLVVSLDWTSIALLLATESSDNSMSAISFVRIARLGRCLKLMGAMRILMKLVQVLETAERLMSTFLSQSGRLAFRSLQMLFVAFLIAHVACCCWFAIGMGGDSNLRWVDANLGGGAEQFLATSRFYQYVTAFHWVIGQFALVGSDVRESTSAERSFAITCVLLGLLGGSMFISFFSAMMVDFRVGKRGRAQKMWALRQYLKQNNVCSRALLGAVWDQISERTGETESLAEKDVSLLLVLSHNLREQIRHEIMRPHLEKYPEK